MLSTKQLKSDYNRIIKAAEYFYQIKNFNDSLRLIELATTLAYQYNFIETFCDMRVEKLIHNIAEDSFQPIQLKQTSKKIVFYDYFGYDNRGLTQQYIRALMYLDFEIIYILETQPKSYKTENIFLELQSYSKSSIYILKGEDHIEKIKEILYILKDECPSKILMHLAPWDVVAVAAFSITSGIRKYQINLTDHAFWIGVSITDICLEFRNFGASLSKKARKINEEKIKILPYYPIINDNIPFKGFPFDAKNKLLIFAGGSSYKILGENLEFLQLVKSILEIDDRMIFILGGSGDLKFIEDFISEHKLKKKFFLLGDRDDISAVVKNCDYFFSTYPMTGALMSQIAAYHCVPSFYYSTDKYICNDLADLFYKIPSGSLEKYKTINMFFERFSEIYTDDFFLKKYGEKLKRSMINPQEFAENLSLILNGENPFESYQMDLDIKQHYKSFSSFLLESENNYNKKYDSIIFSALPNFKSRCKILPRYFIREQKVFLKTSIKRFLKNLFILLSPIKILNN